MSLGYDVKTSIDTTMNMRSGPPFEDPPNLIWCKMYGGNSSSYFDFLQQTSDNGYICVGSIYSYSKWNVFLVKTDIDGNEIWNKTFSGIKETGGQCVRETSDGGFILCGYSVFGTEMIDVLLIKTDENGDLIWEKKFKKEDYEESYGFGESIIEVDDGYLLISSIKDMENIDYNDIWLIKTDFDGNELWNKTVGGSSGRDFGNEVIQTSEGDFLIVGTYKHRYVLLIKTDSNGNRLWRKTIEGGEGYDIKECNDGGYIIAAHDCVCLIKIDKSGHVQWKKEYDWGGFDAALSVDFASDGGYILTGQATVGEPNMLILKTDKNGNREWEKTIGGASGSAGIYIIQSNDDTYVAAGVTRSFGLNAWLVKVAPFENQRPNKPSKPVGPTYIRFGVGYNYTSSSSDPDGDIVYYRWENKFFYGDFGPYNNSEICEVEFWWPLIGKDELLVKSRDIYGGDSEWSDPLEVTVTLTRTRAWLRFLDMFPILQKILYYIL
jgi:hypothetical protein